MHPNDGMINKSTVPDHHAGKQMLVGTLRCHESGC